MAKKLALTSATAEAAEYQAPPVPNIQAQMAALEPRRGLLPEKPTQRQDQEAHLATQVELRESLDRQVAVNPPLSGPTDEAVQRSRADSVEQIRRQIVEGVHLGDSTDRAAAKNRAEAVHAANQDLIRAEMLAGIRRQAYSG